MIKIVEASSIVLIALIAYMLAGKPALDLNLSSVPGSVSAQSGQPSSVAIKKPQDQDGVKSQINENEELKARNIFTANGAYIEAVNKPISPDNMPIPENPYVLIGVIQGKESKAVFRDHTGSVLTMTVGQKLGEESVITSIENASVKLKKGKEESEMKAFEVRNREKTILRKP